MKSPKYIILIILFSIALISSAILVFYDFKPIPEICTPGEGCYAVKNSQYNTMFCGIPNEYLGTGFFWIMILTTLSQMLNPTRKKYMVIVLGISLVSIFALYSIYIQIFLIKAYCKYCMTIDISSLIALALILIFRK